MTQLSRSGRPLSPPHPILLATWLATSIMVGVGFGRFGYALILPSMRADLHLTYAQAGALNSANAFGYLLGALLSAPVLRFFRPRSVMLAGVAVSILALALAGLTRSYPLLLACRATVGISAAFTLISATGLGARLGADAFQNALAMSIVNSGGGLGVALTGVSLPFVLATGDDKWQLAWLCTAACGGILLAGLTYFTRSLAHIPPTAHETLTETRVDFRPLWRGMVAYFLFGLGYIAYMTFLVAYVRTQGASPGIIALTWATMGLVMVLSAAIWKNAMARERGGRVLAAMALLGAMSALLLLCSSSLPVLLISAAGFGMGTMPIFTMVVVLIRLHLPEHCWTNGIAMATVIFALGQGLGPVGSGYFSDHYGPTAALVWSGAILLMGAVVALCQPPKPLEAPAK